MKELFEVTIEVLQRCPNKCIYCSSWSSMDKTEALDLDTICGIVDDAVELGAKQVNISGGEPFLRTDIISIIDYIKSKGLKIRLYTSGIYYDQGYQSIPETLLEAITGKVDTLIFNYETAIPELYARIMGTVPGNLLLIEGTIMKATNLGITVEAHLVPMKCNYQEIPQTLERVYSLGVSKVSLLRFVQQGRSVENVEVTVLAKEEEDALKEMQKELSKKYGDKLRLGKPNRSERFSTCWTGTIRLAVRYDGFVFPCGAFKDGMMTFKGFALENIREKSLSEIYRDSKYIKAVREELAKYYEEEVSEPCFGQYCRNQCN
ncbi:MAG: radical SAM protein [Bacteroidales bacterium]|nr:radical SAM protein [Bacteroidales bacterium]